MTSDETGGAATIWIIAMAVAAFLFTALIVDTARVLAVSTAAGDVAESAGRAAATTVNPITGRLDDPEAAIREGQAIIAAAGMTGTISLTSREVDVKTSMVVELPLLSAVGFGVRTVDARRTIHIESG